MPRQLRIGNISAKDLERRLLGGLQLQMLSPEAVSLAVREYHAERMGSRAEAESRVQKAEAAIARLVKAIADGGADSVDIREALASRRAERDRAASPDAYRRRVETLGKALLEGFNARTSALPVIRPLISMVMIDGDPDAENGVSLRVTGSLDAVLQLASGTTPPPASACRTATLVAEEGLEPPTRGL